MRDYLRHPDRFIHRTNASQSAKHIHHDILAHLPTSPPPQCVMTSLDRFINTIIKLAEPGSIVKRYRLGIGLLSRIFQSTRKGIRSRHLPTVGFKDNLVKHGQKGEMYRHLYFHLACYLLGPMGWAVSWFIGLIDIQQAAKGRKESETEVRDNVAGRECGRILTFYMMGKVDEITARKQLKRVLAD